MDEIIYKIIDGVELRLHVFYPDGYLADRPEPYPVAVSIHGGAWTQGPIEWGHADAMYLSTFGYVGIAVEYRLADSYSVSALDCMKDVHSAVRWIRMNADKLNIDPQRLLIIGHSAGAHMSLGAAMFPDIHEKGEDTEFSSVPNAVVALAPAVNLSKDKYFQGLLLNQVKASDCSPIEHVRKYDMPILIIHGSSDELLPVLDVERFVTKMKQAGNDITLFVYPGGSHSFFYEEEDGIRFWQEKVADFVGRLDKEKSVEHALRI